jgi:hypothetical protein
MEAPIQLEGPEVVEYLSGYNTVRDGVLASVTIQYSEWGRPSVCLVFKVPSKAGVRVVTIELREIVELSYWYEAGYSNDIALVKTLWTNEDEFYLSLDPYDEREAFVSEQDGDVFKAKHVKLSEVMQEVGFPLSRE